MYEVFEQLLQKFGVTTADVCKATGIGQSTMSNWKSRRNLISGKNAQLIADYFGVTPESLLAENEQKKDPAQMSREEKISYIMQKYSQMPEEDRKALEQFADYLLEKREKTPPDDSAGR